MFEIWFGFEDGTWAEAFCLKITNGAANAQRTWDKLAAGGWHMISARP